MFRRLHTEYLTLLDKVQDLLASLAPRDRTLLVGLFTAGTLAIVLGGGWWMSSSLAGLRSRVADRAETLRLMQLMAADHASALEEATAIEEEVRKHAGTELPAYLEQAATRSGVTDRLNNVQDKGIVAAEGALQETRYSVSLSDLTTDELANFLYEVESNGFPLKIRNTKVRARTRREERTLTVDMDISAFRLLETEGGEG